MSQTFRHFSELNQQGNWTYRERLKSLNLHSLERRRIRGDLIEVYKWVKGFNKGDINKVLIVKEQGRTRNNGYKLDKFRFKKDIGKNWFTNRVVNEWNRLGEHVVSAETIDSFKRRLDKFMDDNDRCFFLYLFFFLWAALCRSTGLLQTPSFLMFLYE